MTNAKYIFSDIGLKRQIIIHLTNINRGYIVLCQEGVDPVQGPTKDGLQDDILTGWNKNTFYAE